MKLKNIAITVIVIAIIVLLVKSLIREGTVSGTFIRLKTRNYQPETLTVPPSQPLPVPNGYDTFVKAGKVLVEIPRITTLSKTVRSAKPKGRAAYIPQMRQLVDSNKQALSYWRQGLAQSYYFPIKRSSEPKDECYRYWIAFSRLGQFQSRCQASDGNWSGAANSALDVIQFGITVPRGGHIFEGAFGSTFVNEGRDVLLPCVTHLTPLQIKALLQRLKKIASELVPCADLYQEDLYDTYSYMKTKLLDNDNRDGKPVNPEVQRHAVDMMLEPYIHYMQQRIANARLPYAEQKPVAQPKNDATIAIAAPKLSGLEWRCTAQQAMLDLLQLELALRLYHLEYGRYPAKLNELAPAYLPVVPSDPFARHSSSYIYRLRGKDYILYSVGGNCRDDGGTNPPKPEYDMQGDILDGHTV